MSAHESGVCAGAGAVSVGAGSAGSEVVGAGPLLDDVAGAGAAGSSDEQAARLVARTAVRAKEVMVLAFTSQNVTNGRVGADEAYRRRSEPPA